MAKIAVVTAAVGLSKISLYEPEYTNADYFIFSDVEFKHSKKWTFKKLYNTSIDPHYRERRTAKLPKIMTHYLLPEYDYYIWHDYTHKVDMNPESIIETYLKDYDFAFFKHPHRDSWHTELEEVKKSKLDHTSVLVEQAARFELLNIEKNKNFYECTCFVRKNNEEANKTCSLWYDYVCSFSSRDQISLPAALQQHNATVTTMPGTAQVYFGNNKIIPQYQHSLRLQGLVK